jgi:hypothetical protein
VKKKTFRGGERVRFKRGTSVSRMCPEDMIVLDRDYAGMINRNYNHPSDRLQAVSVKDGLCWDFYADDVEVAQ